MTSELNSVKLLEKVYAGQEATVRTGHGTTDWFEIRKGVHQGCILSPCLFNLYADYIMRNAGLEETQAGRRPSSLDDGGNLGVVVERRPQCAVSHEVRRRGQ